MTSPLLMVLEDHPLPRQSTTCPPADSRLSGDTSCNQRTGRLAAAPPERRRRHRDLRCPRVGHGRFEHPPTGRPDVSGQGQRYESASYRPSCAKRYCIWPIGTNSKFWVELKNPSIYRDCKSRTVFIDILERQNQTRLSRHCRQCNSPSARESRFHPLQPTTNSTTTSECDAERSTR